MMFQFKISNFLLPCVSGSKVRGENVELGEDLSHQH